MNIINNLTWGEVVEYIKAHNEFNPEWKLNKRIDLKTKFYAIDALNIYLEILAGDDNNSFESNFYEFEICKRMMSLGLYLGIMPAITDCKEEYYNFLEQNDYFTYIKQKIDIYDYNDFKQLLIQYIDINSYLFSHNLSQVVTEILEEIKNDNGYSELEKVIKDNQETIEKLGEIIDFNFLNKNEDSINKN